MSLAAMVWAIEAPINRPTAKLALVCLADHADAQGACFPSQKALAMRVGVTDRSLRDALTWLEAEGFIVRSRRERKDGSRTSDHYQLPVEAYGKKFPASRKQSQGLPEASSDLTSFEPVTEPVTVAVSAQKYDVIQSKLLEAAGFGDFRAEKNPKLLDLSSILGLIDAGFDLDNDILQIIRTRNVNGFRPRSWAFYTAAVRDASQNRKSIGAIAKPTAAPISWAAWCAAFFEEGTWIQALGPAPDQPGCKASQDVIAHARKMQHGNTGGPSNSSKDIQKC